MSTQALTPLGGNTRVELIELHGRLRAAMIDVATRLHDFVTSGPETLSVDSTQAAETLNGLRWFWIVLELIVPPWLALLVAWPFWRKGQMIFGNLVGTGVLFGTAFTLIFREHAELDIIIQRCLDDGFVCFPEPSAFTRFAVYAFISLFQVFALFSLSLVVEERMRRRSYAPEWR